MRKRTRNVALPGYLPTGIASQWLDGDMSKSYSQTQLYVGPPTWYNRSWSNVEVCLDELHPGPPYKTGGPFDYFRATDPCVPLQGNGVYEATLGRWTYRYEGGFFPSGQGPITNLATMLNPPSNWTGVCPDVSSYGATGWKMYQPIKPVVNLGQTLYEIRELPRMLHTTAKGFRDTYRAITSGVAKKTLLNPKWYADHWLNTQFGWSPFLNDMAKLFDLQKRLARRYQWLVANNGKWKKRGGAVKKTEQENSSTMYNTTCFYTGGLNMALTEPGLAGQKTVVLDVTKTDIWFEARMRYWLPNMEPYDKWRKDYLSRLGLNPTPSLVYELTPWSWLLDWFTNIGDVIENVSNYGTVVAKYAYVMGHTHRIKRVSTTLPLGNGVAHGSYEFMLERKQRVAANPFGFGLQWSQLTPWHWSILGALGIGRFPTK